MLPAEVQRIILLVGLLATAYLMILAWNEDFGASTQTVVRTEAPTSVATPGSDLPAVEMAEPQSNAVGDLPDESLFSDAPASASQAAAPAADSGRLIKISSQTLVLWIDQLGGDIVRAWLPEHPVTIDQPDTPMQILERAPGKLYVAQSGLGGPDGTDKGGNRPNYRLPAGITAQLQGNTLNLPSDAPFVLPFVAEVDGVVVEKRFTFTPGSYLVGVEHRVENRRSQPFTAGLFAQLKRDNHEPDGTSSFTLGPQPYLGAAVTTDAERYQKVEFDDLADGEDFSDGVDGGWVAILQHYFVSAWVAEPDVRHKLFGYERDGVHFVGYTAPYKTIAPGSTGSYNASFYVGPKDQKVLEQIAPNLNLTVDYGFLWWLAVPLFNLLDWLHDNVAPNWGVAIMLLTLMVKIVLYPLFNTSFRSMANMRRVSPDMKRLQERYADDRQKLSQEMMALYKREKVNPLGGCLPMLLPMPIFLALYWVLFESVELRQAPFFLWINDLSVLDPYFVLPLLMGASMYIQQLLSPAMGDPMQVRMMRLMPVFFTVLFLFFPAGLVLYWLVNNVLSLAQQYWVNRQYDTAAASKA